MELKEYLDPHSGCNEQKVTEIFGTLTAMIFDQIPIPINFVDPQGYIITMNRAFLDYLHLTLAEVKGQHISKIDPTVRLPIVLKTGVAEIGQKHKFQDGREVIAHRIPLFYEGKLIGGVGIILIENFQYIYNIGLESRWVQQAKKESLLKSDFYQAKYSFQQIITCSEAGKQSVRTAKNYAITDFPVLITGESGVGKELFAHAIHQESSRKSKPFIRINCAAIPENLIESELFGYEKGSFTGAEKSGKQGKFEMAEGGTLFLDEIGDLPLTMQAKLLRVLQEKEVERIGGNRLIPINVRVIAATNRHLEEQVREGQFRQDLFYRLYVLHLPIPSLKERPEDIPLLTEHMISNMRQQYGIHRQFSQEVLEILKNYSWPGNIRELKNTVERIAVSTEKEIIEKADLPDYLLQEAYEKSLVPEAQLLYEKNSSLKKTLAAIEKKLILSTLRECDGNKAKAAHVLGIPRMTLYRKIEIYEKQSRKQDCFPF